MINQTNKYSRQTIIPEIGASGQKKLSRKTVAIVGIGALGTVAAELLVRAGIGNLILIDRDVVEISNLQRQFLFTEKYLHKSKAQTAKLKLEEINSDCKIKAYPVQLNAENIFLLKSANLLLDCTDNLKTRFLLNDFCRKEKIPWIYSAAIKTSGYVMPIFPGGPCLKCFLKEASLDTCETVGVLNTITASIAALQVNLALKILTDNNFNNKVNSKLYYYNIWAPSLKIIKVKKNKNCPACNGNYGHLTNKQDRVIKFCSAGKYQIMGNKKDFTKIKKLWGMLDTVLDDGIALHFKNIMLFKDGRTLIKAKSEQEAQAIYSKYIGN